MRKRLKPRRLRFWRGPRLRPPELRVPINHGHRRIRKRDRIYRAIGVPTVR